MGRYDITIASANPAPTFAATGFMLTGPAVMQDITPASTRRSDGDARYLLIQSESFWGQNDWSGGYGLVYPPDPTSFQDGPADTLTPHRLRAAYAPVDITPYTFGVQFRGLCRVGGQIYAIASDSSTTHRLLFWSSGTNTWTVAANLPQKPVALCWFRGKVWIAYDTVASVQAWDGTTLATVSPAFQARALCPFGSMLFYVRWDSANGTYRINRYDPENPAAVPDLAILPVDYLPVSYGVSLCALGGDLYIALNHQLWRFTSANGNSGVLQGPLDSWTPVGGHLANFASCACLASYQGALYYSSGSNLRRYVPGGQPRVAWPDPGRNTAPGEYFFYNVFDLDVADDRLYVAATRSTATGTYASYPIFLLVWDGAGMHRLGQVAPATYGPATITEAPAFVRADGQGRVFLSTGYQYATGARDGYFKIGGVQGRWYLEGSAWKSSWLDFGMIDIEKSLASVGVAAIVPAGQNIAVSVAIDGAAPVALTRTGTFSSAFPAIVYFVPPTGQVLVGKIFELRVSFSLGGGLGQSPEIWSLQAIPNPINPLRRGGRLTIALGEGVLDHAGNRVYADEAAVAAALALVKSLRREKHPLWLTWLDGEVLLARLNTLTIQRVASLAGADPQWAVSCDWQEIS